MKKIISMILTVSLLISSFGILAFAEKEKDTPVIFIPGFLQPYIYIEGEDGSQEQYVWPPEKKRVKARIADDLPNFINSIFRLIFMGDVENFGETLGGGAYAIAEKMQCYDDGTSIYPIKHYENNPAISNAEYLKKTVSKDSERKVLLFEKFINYIEENNYAELGNIFVFEYDSRFDSITIAEELREFIKDVKEYTKSEKVNLFTVSYGGLIASTYLYYHMDECDINKAVLNVPPLEGTDFPDRLFRKNVNLPMRTLIDFVESILGLGTNISSLISSDEADFLNTLMNSASPSLMSVVVKWSSLYALSTTELYEGMKRDFLDPVKNEKIIKNNDIIHYEIMPKMHETFEKCEKLGTDVSIIAGTGSSICLGGELNGDILVPAYSATGALVKNQGERFEDGYTGVKTTCAKDEHNHISPSMEIDASCSFLPEKTWFIDSSYHAMYECEEYAMSLCAKLLFTDELKDVHSDRNYPQFEYSNNPHNGVHASFNESLTGYLSSKDTSVIIENIYSRNIITVTKVEVEGAELNFDIPFNSLKPGDKIEISFTGNVPEANAKRSNLIISYIKVGTTNGFEEVSIPITINK